jgi:phosphopantetheinyl transferase (holo-ACP synthase)
MNKIIEFLSNLLNTPLNDKEAITLTSAQQARFLSWSDRNGIAIEPKSLQVAFTLTDLFENSAGQSFHQIKSTHVEKNYNSRNKSNSRVGIDIQSISEMFPVSMELDYLELTLLYTSYELEYSKNSNEPKSTLAGLFSLKESLIKAGAGHSDYLDLEITHTVDGLPVFYGYEVSISHSGDFVTSIAIRS